MEYHSLYRPLLFSQNEIRILVIAPTETISDPVKCQLEYASLELEPKYDALSYCWGRPDRREAIHVDHRQLSVTLNLAAALRALRSSGILRVWADAVCINQDDLEERSQQVLKMGAIYRSAKSVIAWLGYSHVELDRNARNVGEAVEAMVPILAHYSTLVQHIVRKKHDLVRKSSSYALERRLRHEIELREQELLQCTTTIKKLKQSDWTLFKELVDHPYWTRVWIIQEFAMARQLRIIWNGRSFGETAIAKSSKPATLYNTRWSPPRGSPLSAATRSPSSGGSGKPNVDLPHQGC